MARWTSVIGATGGLFVVFSAVAVGDLLDGVAVVDGLIASLPTVVLGLVLLYGGLWLSRSDLHPETYPRILAWCLGGGGLLLANIGLLTLNPDVTINNPVQTVTLGTAIGAVAGFAIGANEARAITRGREAEQGREVLGFLNSTLRHEVLNDLTVIRGTATELAKESDEESRAELDVIVDRCDDLADLIEDIGPLSRALTGRDEPTSIELSRVVAERTDAVGKAYPEATVTAEVPADVRVLATEGLSRAISNLLVNAVEHNDADTPRVEVTASATAETVRLTVADNGPGIDDEEKERIFLPGTERDRGFGLYMTRTLVSQFGGDIRVEDNDPRGSVFVIELPRADAA